MSFTPTQADEITAALKKIAAILSEWWKLQGGN